SVALTKDRLVSFVILFEERDGEIAVAKMPVRSPEAILGDKREGFVGPEQFPSQGHHFLELRQGARIVVDRCQRVADRVTQLHFDFRFSRKLAVDPFGGALQEYANFQVRVGRYAAGRLRVWAGEAQQVVVEEVDDGGGDRGFAGRFAGRLGGEG